MNIIADKFSTIDAIAVVSIRCPGCKHKAVFEKIGLNDLILSGNPNINVGLRRCPDHECNTLIFFAHRGGQVILSYPAERIDIDSTNIPTQILAPLEEAITCHANQCYTASAIMVRKTLEELCTDRKVTGNNLKEKIKNLSTSVILPQELLDSMDNLRLLGNDAAHIESQHYNQIGKEEVEIAIEVAKEVLKGVFQYSALLKRLNNLKKP